MAVEGSKADSTKASAGVDDVLEHVRAIKEDFAALAASTAKLAAGQAKTQAKRLGALTDDAAEKAASYRDILVDKVKERPLASLGAAVLVGLVLSSLSRR